VTAAATLHPEAPTRELLLLGQSVIERARKAGADIAECTVRKGAHLSTKVRSRQPELVEEAGSSSVGLRVFIGDRVGVVVTSDVSPAGLSRLVEDAIEVGKLSEPDPFAGPPDIALLCPPDKRPDLLLYDPTMSAMDAAEALERAKAGEIAAFSFDDRISNSEGATFSRMAGSSALCTSQGFRGAASGTYASLVVRPVANDQDGKKRSGFHWTAKRHLAELDDGEEVGKEAARRTLRKLGARKIETTEAPVVFDPDAGRSILGLFSGCINGNAIWRQTSYLVGREGSRVASEHVTVVDDPLIAKAPASRPYDGEGLASRRNVVVRKGVLETYLMDSYAARKLKKESTASASRGSSGAVSAGTTNFILEPTSLSAEALLKSTARGLYVTEMMGFGFNAVTGDFSRGAAGFWIENGELAFPVSEVTISLNFDQLLQRIDAVAEDLDLRTSTATPTFRVSAMTIAGK